MAEPASTAADSDPVEQQLTFNIKASNDQKFVLTLPISTTIADVKNKLAGSDYADIPAERIRLIYSGRVLKNEDTLSTHNVKDGNTIHMVKGAMSNARQNPAASTSSAAAPAVPALPNMATGTGNNPLAGLTGARYAGFHGLPSANMFGADGGVSAQNLLRQRDTADISQMGAPPPPDEMLRMLDDPNFAQTMNEALNNPDMLRILEQHPMMRDNPQLRNMIRNPEMRRLMFNPEMLRMQLQMQRTMGGDSGAGGDFPAPGLTDQTPGAAGAGAGAAPAGNAQQQANPLASLFGNMGAGGAGPAGGANPLAALFGNMGAGTTPATSPPAAASAGQGTPSTNPGQAQDPFANLFGAAQGGAGGSDPLAQMTRTMMQNPEMMRNVMQMMGGQDGPAATGGQAGGAAANPFAALFNPYGGMGGMMPPQAQEPPDTRPPEERYESQLRQLNDMGFYEFDRNIAALRRSGGSVQGAIEHLLGGGS
jgi:ubiquilin